MSLIGGVALLMASSCAQAGDRHSLGNQVAPSTEKGSTGTQGAGGGGTGGATEPPSEAASSVATTGAGGTGSGGNEPCDESPCKLTSPQCGCAIGEMCNAFLGNRSCITEGSQQQGEECGTNGLNCAAGLRCIELANTVGRCQRYCDSDTECQLPGGRCVFDISDTQGTKVCSENCDPVTSQGCSFAGQRCTAGFDDNNTGFTLCLASGAGTQGATCTAESDCAAGYSCVTVDSQQACRKWCTVGDTCLTQCIQAADFDPPLVVGTVTYGVCAN